MNNFWKTEINRYGTNFWKISKIYKDRKTFQYVGKKKDEKLFDLNKWSIGKNCESVYIHIC